MKSNSTTRIKVINEFLSKILDVLCVFWSIGWAAVGVKFMLDGNPIYTLSVVFLYGTPALLYLYYRYAHHYRDLRLERKAKRDAVEIQ